VSLRVVASRHAVDRFAYVHGVGVLVASDHAVEVDTEPVLDDALQPGPVGARSVILMSRRSSVRT
jgi:hypothetical protein